jgi:hypothetical protein
MSEKLYHKQPCFCLPCKAIKSEKKQPADKASGKAKKRVE